MKSREDVIKGLECCATSDLGNCKDCPYSGDSCVDLCNDAAALLKAQEGVFPHMVDWGIYECPKCKTRVDKTYKYCKCCGQGVKWE